MVNQPPGFDFWEFQVNDLHQNIAACRWYEAKQNLAHLKEIQPERYQADAFVLTEAWIAEQEHSWQKVLLAYDAWDQEHHWTYIPKLRSMVGLGLYEEAFAFYVAKSHKFKGRAKWEAMRLYAQALRECLQYEKALAVYQKLRHKKAPRSMRMEALYYSAAIRYSQSERKKGRALVAALHETWPGSDEALDGIHLQERSETEGYLDQFATWDRFSWVAYSNRDFARAAKYFQKIVAHGPSSYERDRARYFLALIPLKLGEPEEGLTAFQGFLDAQEGGRYYGLGAFQYARSLLMLSRDEEAIQFCKPMWDESEKPAEWLQDCARILILALRRSRDEESFRRIEFQLEQKAASPSLRRFYHRNGVVWALQRELPHVANHHLQKLKRYRLRRGERQEASVWQGLIDWELGREDQAIKLWLDVATQDPNHYFGLVASQLLQVYGELDQRWQQMPKDADFLAKIQNPKRLHRLYHLAPSGLEKTAVAARLQTLFPKLRTDIDYRVLPERSDARLFAQIGRFDWAGKALKPGETDKRTAQFLKAKWHLAEGQYQRAIIWGEGLLRSYPKWTPYELIPQDVQEFIYPEGFASIVHKKAKDFEVDPYLLLAIIREESKFNAQAKSVASARGLMQFIPSTANAIASEVDSLKDFSLSKLYEPETSITLGARYVDKLMELFDGRSLQTVAAYNAGELTVARWTSYSDEFHPLHFVWDVAYNETKYYCQKVLRAYYHYARVYDETFNQTLLKADHLTPPLPTLTDEPSSWRPSNVLVTD